MARQIVHSSSYFDFAAQIAPLKMRFGKKSQKVGFELTICSTSVSPITSRKQEYLKGQMEICSMTSTASWNELPQRRGNAN